MPVTLPYPVEEDAFYKRGLEKGIEKGLQKGTETISMIVLSMHQLGKSAKEISTLTSLPLKQIQEIIKIKK